MTRNLRDPKTAGEDHASMPGLNPDELRAEQAGDLPDRDAMSVIGLGGITGGLPPADILDGILTSDLPVSTQPVDGLPLEQYPIDPLPPVSGLPGGLPVGPPAGLPEVPPIDSLPSLDAVDDRIDNLPIDAILDGNATDTPDVSADADASVEV
jgi:hypothetical protein